MLIYCVMVEFNEAYLSKIDEFLSENFNPSEVLSKKENKVKLLFEINEEDGPGELENQLYTILDGWKVGVLSEYKEIV